MQVFIKVSSYVRCAQDGYLDYSDLGIWFMPRKWKCVRNCYQDSSLLCVLWGTPCMLWEGCVLNILWTRVFF